MPQSGARDAIAVIAKRLSAKPRDVLQLRVVGAEGFEIDFLVLKWYNIPRVTKMSNQYLKEINGIIEKASATKILKNLTVKEWFPIFLSDYCQNIKQSTLASYQQAFRNHISEILGDVELNKLCSEVVQFFIKILSMGDDKRKPLAAKSVKNIYGVLHKGLSIAYKLGYMNKDISNMVVILPKNNQTEIKPLTNDEIILLLDELEGSKYQNIITTAIFTGMRQSELLGLKWRDIDFNGCKINISRQLVRDKITHKYVLTALKNDKPRSLCPAPFLISMLKKEFEGSGSDRDGFVFVNEHGDHFSHNAVYRFFKKTARKCLKRDNIRFHDLRHTYAVLSLQAGDDYKTLQENMGHYSAAFTLDRYGHCTDNMKSVSSQRMEDYYRSVFVAKPKENSPQAIKIVV